MSPRDRHVSELVEAVRKRSPNERAAYLDEACGEDAELRAEVERMADDAADTSDDGDSATIGTDAPTRPLGESATVRVPPATHVGSYRILGILGEGSMGVVYRAEQDNPHRVVALKVLKAGGASAKSLKRFEHEAQMLGRLQHPGIAQIFEAGTADTGYGPQPFFVMELIQGVPLTVYAEGHGLGIRERLALMVKVCAGVEHAHQKGIIHRDLKPGNILVDGVGQPKILDFGIALATDSDVQTSASRTDLEQLAGTVPYMSLEQVKGDPRDLDTRTDVYALGVSTFQLLTGRLPYDLKHKTIPEAVRIIGEREPRRLGTIDRTLRGDLEMIMAKALEKDKAHRYQSASDLAADIRRYLADEPILARPPSAVYQFHKFAKRNRAAVVGAVAVLVVFLVAFGLTERARRDAANEATKAHVSNKFLDKMFSSADPTNALGENVTVRSMLDEAARRIEQGELADQPEVEAQVRLTLGKTYRSLGLYETAEPHLGSALETNRRELGGEHERTLTSMNELALLYNGQGRYDEAEALLLEVVATRERTLGDDDPETLASKDNLAVSYRKQGRHAEAERMCLNVLEARRRVLGDEHPDTLGSMNNLALVYKTQGKWDASERLYRQALETQRRVLDDEHPDMLSSMNNLASLLHAKRTYSEAAQLYRQALESQRRILGPEHPSTLTSMQNLAVSLQEQGKLDEAEGLYRETLGLLRRKLGNRHPHTIASIESLGWVLRKKGLYAEAESLHREALELRRALWPEGHASISTSLVKLGLLLLEKGDAAGAEPFLRDCLAMRRQALPEGDWRTASAESALGASLTKLGRFREAEPLLLDSHPIIEAQWGRADWRTQRAVDWIIDLYEAWGKPDRAAEYRALLQEAAEERSTARPSAATKG